jgi:hypothetical protein
VWGIAQHKGAGPKRRPLSAAHVRASLCSRVREREAARARAQGRAHAKKRRAPPRPGPAARGGRARGGEPRPRAAGPPKTRALMARCTRGTSSCSAATRGTRSGRARRAGGRRRWAERSTPLAGGRPAGRGPTPSRQAPLGRAGPLPLLALAHPIPAPNSRSAQSRTWQRGSSKSSSPPCSGGSSARAPASSDGAAAMLPRRRPRRLARARRPPPRPPGGRRRAAPRAAARERARGERRALEGRGAERAPLAGLRRALRGTRRALAARRKAPPPRCPRRREMLQARRAPNGSPEMAYPGQPRLRWPRRGNVVASKARGGPRRPKWDVSTAAQQEREVSRVVLWKMTNTWNDFTPRASGKGGALQSLPGV